MRHINFTYLQYFYDAAINKSLSAAARENFVSQSAISQGISKLEIALQTKLTTHQKRKFQLTQEGEVVFNEAKRLFSTVAGLKDRLSELKGEISGEMKFACTNSLAQFFLPTAYLLMRKKYPKVGMKLHRGSLKFIHESLRNEKVDFALVLDSPEFNRYDRIPLAQGHFRLYKSKNLQKSSGIIVDHLENDEVKELRERYRKKYGKELEILDALSGWALVLVFVQLCHGIGYLPEFLVKGNKEIEEVQFDIKPIEYSICMIKLKDSLLSRAESVFLDLLKGVK